MSARNYTLSARERNSCKLIDYLPQINQQKLGCRSRNGLPALSANASNLVNRNLKYSAKMQPYSDDSPERASTPFSDFFTESETGTPDFRSEESDSSSGSAFRRNTAEATKILMKEWEQIERTLYDEDGEISNRPQILEECKQWKQLHPQLRVVGKSIKLPEKRICYRQMDHEEVIAMCYSDYEQFSESEERLSQSSADITPENSPRNSFIDNIYEPKLSREKVSFKLDDDIDLQDTFCSLLHITPIQIRSPSNRKKHNYSVIKSDLASSRWMRNRPESSIQCERNSAKSFVSLETRSNFTVDNNKVLNARVLTARHRELARLEPLYTTNDESRIVHGVSQFNIRKISLPPLLLEDEKKKFSIGSAKKTFRSKKIPKGHKDKFG